jgi:hypothetical protein
VQHDLAAPERWLASRRRSRSRRLAVARTAARRRLGRHGAVALVAAMSLGTGGAVAAQTGGSAPSASASAKGSGVAAVQRALGIPADGIAGPQTRRAVKRFQRAHGLVVDGVVGPVTLAALGLKGAAPLKTSMPKAKTKAYSGGGTLERIAACESGGDPTAVSASGQYRGKYQFSRATWRSLGGTGDPAAASEAEQDRRAAQLLASQGTAPWPNCA